MTLRTMGPEASERFDRLCRAVSARRRGLTLHQLGDCQALARELETRSLWWTGWSSWRAPSPLLEIHPEFQESIRTIRRNVPEPDGQEDFANTAKGGEAVAGLILRKLRRTWKVEPAGVEA